MGRAYDASGEPTLHSRRRDEEQNRALLRAILHNEYRVIEAAGDPEDLPAIATEQADRGSRLLHAELSLRIRAFSLTASSCAGPWKEKCSSIEATKGGPRKGFGLGLHKVKLVADGDGGSAEVTDRDGGGAIFRVRPRAA
jgi:hypothetical protein